MIINENNKNTILKGMVKRGLNQDPSELRAKLHPDAGKIKESDSQKTVKQINKGTISQGGLRETLGSLRRLK